MANGVGNGLQELGKKIANILPGPSWRNCQLCVSCGRSGDQLPWQKCLAVDCRCSRLSHRPGYKTARLNAKAPNARTATSQILFVSCTVGCAGSSFACRCALLSGCAGTPGAFFAGGRIFWPVHFWRFSCHVGNAHFFVPFVVAPELHSCPSLLELVVISPPRSLC